MREGQLGTLRPGQVCAAWPPWAPQAEASAPASPRVTASVPEAHSCPSPAQAAERDARKAGSGLPGSAPRLQEVPLQVYRRKHVMLPIYILPINVIYSPRELRGARKESETFPVAAPAP